MVRVRVRRLLSMSKDIAYCNEFVTCFHDMIYSRGLLVIVFVVMFAVMLVVMFVVMFSLTAYCHGLLLWFTLILLHTFHGSLVMNLML